jgi:hypothetical protein
MLKTILNLNTVLKIIAIGMKAKVAKFLKNTTAPGDCLHANHQLFIMLFILHVGSFSGGISSSEGVYLSPLPLSIPIWVYSICLGSCLG